MADIQITSSLGGRGVRRAKRLSTKVDLTPMVDLGFLLITFFVFTTSMTKPVAMNFFLPADGEPTLTAESKTLNLVLSGDNKIHYYLGKDVGKQSCADFSTSGIREVLRYMQSMVRSRFGPDAQPVILIRPTKQSSYGNLVDILDEINIAGIKKYALMEEPDESVTRPSNMKQPC